MSQRLRIVAIVSVYNEADIFEQTLQHLADQGVESYVLDDGSTDGSADIAEARIGRGVIGVERREPSDAGTFSWVPILVRKTALSQELEADWFIHHDADEFRETPWPGVTLQQGIEHVSALGYNAIDFSVLNFRPVDDRFRPGTDVSEAFEFWEPAGPYDARQVKCWRKGDSTVDLLSSGGHDVAFPGRCVFPVRFLLRHYPIRSREQGARKVFLERQARFDPDERARGWHRQYDGVAADEPFIWDRRTLTRYDPAGVRRTLAEGLGADDVNCERATMEHEAAGRESRRRAEEVARLSAELDAMYASRSWRITAPLRSVYRRIASLPPSSDPASNVRADTAPASRTWGFDRGLPIDRHYIHAFLDAHRADVQGRVLEVKGRDYTREFGGDRVTDSQVLDIDSANTEATVIGDLGLPGDVGVAPVDCFILTQTLHIIYNVREAVAQATSLLAPGGVLLCTIPAVSRVSDEDGGLESGDYWRMTQAAVRALFLEVLPPEDVHVTTYGNVRVCAAFLYGLAAEEMTKEELASVDPWFPLIHCVRAIKRP